MRLTIFFDSQYWVGVLEDQRDGLYFAARHVFGPEPNDEIIYEFVTHEAVRLMRGMTAGIPAADAPVLLPTNPKRVQRMIRRELAAVRPDEDAAEAVRIERERIKTERAKQARIEREREAEYKRAVALAKAKAKRRGH